LESIGASDIKLPENQQEREYKNEELWQPKGYK
jgi:hypothetical protein